MPAQRPGRKKSIEAFMLVNSDGEPLADYDLLCIYRTNGAAECAMCGDERVIPVSISPHPRKRKAKE